MDPSGGGPSIDQLQGQMKHYQLLLFLLILSAARAVAQTTLVNGRIVDRDSFKPLQEVQLTIEGTGLGALSDKEGRFVIDAAEVPYGPQLLLIAKTGYLPQRIRIVLEADQAVELDPILLQFDTVEAERLIGVVSIADVELDSDEGVVYNTAGLLQAERDVFLRAAAFDFSTAFFRPRGYDNSDGKLLINGVEMNDFSNGRPEWASWGGLNDAQRIREFSMGLRASDQAFGDLAGTTNIVMRPSLYRKGIRVSYASSNRTYLGRVMASYNSGTGSKGWSFSVLASRRYGRQGFVEGTLYDANSLFAGVEKSWRGHSLAAAVLYTPVRRGRGTALTAEVIRLKGNRYNPHWGLQDGQIRSARVREISQPVAMLSHYWEMSEKVRLQTNLAYQSGRMSDSRLESSGLRNPVANFYQRLPSYFLREPDPGPYDFQLAYLAAQKFQENGQLDWSAFYRANTSTAGGRSLYILQDDVREQQQLWFNSIFSARTGRHLVLNAALNFRDSKNDHYAQVKDLLGGMGYLDIDYFGDDSNKVQSDLDNPERTVGRGERFKYNYQLHAQSFAGFVQVRFDYRNIDFFLSGSAAQTTYQRIGLYRNGYFPEESRSLGPGPTVSFFDFGLKGGATYSITGRHLIELNTAHFTKPPNLRSTFANVRQNNDLVMDARSSTRQSVDISYLYRGPWLQLRLTGFYSRMANGTDIRFYFTQNALGNADNSAFVQEITTGIGRTNTGIEFGAEVNVLEGLKARGAAAYGSYSYSANGLLYLAGDDFDDPLTEVHEGNDLFSRGRRQVSLSNYHTASGPELACQLGLEYRSASYWWFGSSLNYFDRAFVDISKLRRTPDFITDIDGQPFNGYSEEVARDLLRQERLADYFLLNLVGGKSWRFGRITAGFFAAVNNLLGQEYLSGGFEDSRRSSYVQQIEEQGRPYGPLFGNRYFQGYGTTYYLNVYIRY
jgi:hypothetical protein